MGRRSTSPTDGTADGCRRQSAALYQDSLSYVPLTSAAKIAFTTAPSGAIAGSAFAVQPAVTVENVAGSTVTTDSSAVTLTLTSGPGTLSGCTTTVNAVNGVARFSGCSISTAGTYVLTATDGSFSATTSFTVSGPAAQVVFGAQPGNGISASALAAQPVATVEDAAGNVVTASSAPVTLSLTSGGGTGAGTLTGCTTAVNAVNGVATFAGCAVSVTTDGTFTLTAASPGLAAATSRAFTVTGAATKVVFSAQPANGISRSVLAAQPVATVEDAAGNMVTASSAPVTLSLTSGGGTGAGTLTGCTKAVNAVNGVATFAGCAVSVTTDGTFTLTAAASGLTAATSQVFTVTGAATKVVFTAAPSAGSHTSNLSAQPTVAVEDAAGHAVVADSSSQVNLVIASGTGTLTCTSADPLTVVNGVAKFAGCKISAAGTFTLKATDGSLTSATERVVQVELAARPADSPDAVVGILRDAGRRTTDGEAAGRLRAGLTGSGSELTGQAGVTSTSTQ